MSSKINEIIYGVPPRGHLTSFYTSRLENLKVGESTVLKEYSVNNARCVSKIASHVGKRNKGFKFTQRKVMIRNVAMIQVWRTK